VENKMSIKVSPKAKEFLKQILINRIKIDKTPLNSLSDGLELIQKYFKLNNTEYLKMLQEEL
jgi:hypothetical protein